MKRLLYIAGLAALSGSMLGGCNTTGCTENHNSVPLAGFYSMQTGDAVSIDSLAVGGEGAPNDSLLLGPSERGSEVYLPLRADRNATTFVIKYMQKALAEHGVQDRITFYYESTPWFASEECGAMYHYRITRVSHTTQILDSVGISDSLVTNIERQTIGLYFRTSDPDTPDNPDTPETPDNHDTPPETPDSPEPGGSQDNPDGTVPSDNPDSKL